MMRTNGKYSLIEHQIYNLLTQTYKYNTAVACGILANIQRESNFNPKAINDSSGAYGLVQWLGTRRTNLINYCKNHNYGSYSTASGQIAFMIHELATTEKKTGNSLAAVYNNAEGAYDAGYIFSRDFERHGNTAEDKDRGDLAKGDFWGFYSTYSPSSGDPEVSVTNVGDKIVAYARSEIGSPYSPGGKGPDTYDDVGLVHAAYGSVGRDIPYMSAKALYNRLNYSNKVTEAEASAGDLIFHNAGDYFTVAIATGNGSMVSADIREGKVVEGSIDDPYAILRVLADTETGNTPGTSSPSASATFTYDENTVINTLSRVSAEGYDYGYLIDTVHGGSFKFYIPEFTEQAGANWSTVSIIGRSVEIKAYGNTSSRTVTVSLDLYASEGLYNDSTSEDIVGKMHSDLNFVKSLEYPDYSDAVIQPPPKVRLLLGSAFSITGVVSGVSVEHMKPLDSQNRAMYAKLSFTVTQIAENPPDLYDIRQSSSNMADTSDISSISPDDFNSSSFINTEPNEENLPATMSWDQLLRLIADFVKLGYTKARVRHEVKKEFELRNLTLYEDVLERALREVWGEKE